MDTINVNYFGEKFDELQTLETGSAFSDLRQEGFETFSKAGFPNTRNEEWKYTDISSQFKRAYQLPAFTAPTAISIADVNLIRLPGHESANELVFVNGIYRAELSNIRSSAHALTVLTLEEAANGTYQNIVKEHLGKSSSYIKDGVHALNTSFIHGGVFIHIAKDQDPGQPVYLYHLSDSRAYPTLSQPRSLIYTEENSRLQIVEIYHTIGESASFLNEVMEVVVNQNAFLEYYRIQHDTANSNQVNTTHIRQIGKSYVHALTVSLSGGVIRNNMNLIMEAAGSEGHLYGLYLLNDHTHVDNHTLVDNLAPNCLSNEFYKGIIDDYASGVFSGKILVQRLAQKTNAYQSNKNILLSDYATINTKPQLEIFADDVKCSHGCTVGQLDDEALFYLRSRGLSKKKAQFMLLKAFSTDILNQIKLENLRDHVEELITNRLFVS